MQLREREFDLSAYNIQINSSYFLVSIENLSSGQYFAMDNTDYYRSWFIDMTGPEKLFLSVEQTTWLLGAYITDYQMPLAAPQVYINPISESELDLYWLAVAGANSYKIYGSLQPANEQNWVLIDSTVSLNYISQSLASQYFYRVVASTDIIPLNRFTNSSAIIRKERPSDLIQIKNHIPNPK